MEYIFGTIVLYAYTFEPYGWYKCDGRSLPISENDVLFSLIGNAYGGSGNNFNLPNMLGLEPIPNMNFYICNNGMYPTRS